MKRVLSRLIVVSLMASTLSVVVAGNAWAPRSWLLPNLSVTCQVGDSRPETFTGSFDLNHAVAQGDVVMIGGSLAGDCGAAAIDTFFRTGVTVQDADCTEATLVLDDVLLEKDVLVKLSEQPIEVLGTSNKMRRALCPLKNADKLPAKPLADKLDLLLDI